jgi:hypothetical protein
MAKFRLSKGQSGLYLAVDASGARRGVYKFTLRGDTHWMRCGGGILAKTTADAVEIWTAARDEAKGYRALKARGIDPLRHVRMVQQKAADRKTFHDCAQEVLANKRKEGLTSGTMKSWVVTLEVTCDPFKVRFVDDIETKDIVRPVQTLPPFTGEKCQNRLEEVFAYAIAHAVFAQDQTWQRGEGI